MWRALLHLVFLISSSSIKGSLVSLTNKWDPIISLGIGRNILAPPKEKAKLDCLHGLISQLHVSISFDKWLSKLSSNIIFYVSNIRDLND